MDIASILGIFSAFGLVLIALGSGGGINLFVNIPSLLIVVGGTLGATMINYPPGDFLNAFKIVKNIFFTKKTSMTAIAGLFVDYASQARREGILALEANVQEIRDPFMQKGMQLSIDGLEPNIISDILEKEIDSMRGRHKLGAEIFSTMGTFAPALGMIGTLIGLVKMLQSMDDPNSIGPAMAIALLTTFYGSVMANLIFMPIAGKLKTRSNEESKIMEMIVAGIVALTNGDNPRIMEQKIMVFLPPEKRKSRFY